ncbi:MAG: ABC transporter permease, partial [Spirochaetota bacterium]
MRAAHDIYQMVKISVRNIWRNRRRSIMTMLGICVGTVTLISLGGYVKIMDIGLKDQAINKDFGHFQVGRPGCFADDHSAEYLLPEEEFTLTENKLYELEEVEFVNKRLYIAGIIGNLKKSTVFGGTCGQADVEIFMLPHIVQGEPLSGTDPTGIVIGRSLASKLGVSVNDNLIVFFPSETGAQEAINVSVRGVYQGLFKEQETFTIYLPLETAWELMLEKKVHRILVFLRDIKKLNKAIEEIRNFIEENHLDLEVKPWYELAVYYRQIIAMFKNIILFGGVIIFFIIIFSIANTMYMVIGERTREIGTLRAIGNSRF